MKKIVALFAIVSLVSCGNGTSTVSNSDSSAIVVDSTKTDSTIVNVDSAKAEKAVEVK